MTSLPELLLAGAREDPGRPFLVFEGRTLSRGEVAEAALRSAGWFARAGLRPGDRVATLLENQPELLTTWFGANLAGAVAVPLDPVLRGDELAARLGDTRPRAVVAEPSALPALLALQDRVPSLRHLIIAGAAPAGTTAWSELFGGPAGQPVSLQPDAPMEILYTAGVTARARAVTWRHAGLATTGGALAKLLGLAACDRLMIVLPLFAANAQVSVAMAVASGASILLERRFSARRFWSVARKGGVTQVSLPGLLLSELYARRPRRDDAQHSVQLVLGVATPQDLHEAFEHRFNLCVVEGFGLTEATGFVTVNPVERGRRKLGTIGLPVPWADVAVLDDRLRRLPPGVPGEICVRPRAGSAGPWMAGYLEGAGGTRAARRAWLRSGDVGICDEEGFLTFVDRREDNAHRQGERSSTRTIENALLRHPAVAEAAVLALPDGRSDESLAVVVLRAPVQLEELARFCRDWLANHPTPSWFKVVERIPKTPSGRVRKAELRSEPGIFEHMRRVGVE
jgi:crotonobetaine/carnitine-CoA ligase